MRYIPEYEITPNPLLTLDDRIAARLRALRQERGWSLDELAKLSGVSRASLARLEHGDVSPTAKVLGKICSVYSVTMSRLMAMAETEYEALIRRDDQEVWRDPETGFTRRQVSPPSQSLAAEILECEIPPGTSITYDKPPRPGLEHHLVMLLGQLVLTLDDEAYTLNEGDCLRYQLFGSSRFETSEVMLARYRLVIV